LTLREKFGRGIFKQEDDEIARELSDAVKNTCSTPKRNRFHSMMASTVTSIMQDLVAPWINKCFDKYTEDEFHYKMYQGQFDFVKDWEENHPETYHSFLRNARRVNRMGLLNLDHYAIFNVVMKMFEKRGWNVNDHERIKLLETILQVIAEICK
jgi:hypothetical protein